MTRRLRSLGRGVLGTFRLPPLEILTTFHATAVIVVVELLIRSVPLPRLSRLLGCPVNLDPVTPGTRRLSLRELPERARRQVRCTRRVTHVWPFSQGPCLRSALVGGHLLRKLDPSIRLGINTAGADLQAHAWLEIDGRPLEHVAAYDAFHTANEDDHLDVLDDASINRTSHVPGGGE